MEQKRKSSMLAKARGKYGKPVYPGKPYKTERVSKVEQLETRKRLNADELQQPRQTAMEVWDKAKEFLKEEVSPVFYETWIEPCQPIEFTVGKFVLMVENEFFKEMIERRYYSTIRNAIQYVAPENNTGFELITESEYKLSENVGWGR